MENKKILIVDDDKMNRLILRKKLENFYEICEACSGEEALLKIGGFKPAAVLLDINLGGIDGYQVAQKMKTSEENHFRKIIMVSGKTRVDEKLMGYECGVEDYITKPFSADEVFAKVGVYVDLFNLEESLRIENKFLQQQIDSQGEELSENIHLASVGLRTGEIVHNLNNPIAIIRAYTDVLDKKKPGLVEVQKIDKAVKRVLNMIGDVMSDVRRPVVQNAYLVSEVIHEELDFIKSTDFGKRNKLEVELALDFQGDVVASRSHLSQIVSNLIRNSCEAMPESPKAKLRVATRSIGGFLEIVVTDNGDGISEENIEKVMQPLFTTKDGNDGRSLGTGLGLAFCKKVIESYGGQLHIDSKVNVGTSVIVMIPKCRIAA